MLFRNSQGKVQSKTGQPATEPVIWFLYGMSGAGKSWVADRLGEYFGWTVYHADDDITREMKDALARSQPFTPAMRDAYFQRLAALLQQRLNESGGQDILVSQGAYKRKHRRFLAEQIPNLRAIWVDAPVSLWEARIKNRQEGISLSSAKALQRDFEPPDTLEDEADRLMNDSDFAHVLEQFLAIRSRSQRER